VPALLLLLAQNTTEQLPAPVSFVCGYAVKDAPARLFIRFFRRVPPPLAAVIILASAPWIRSDICHALKSFFQVSVNVAELYCLGIYPDLAEFSAVWFVFPVLPFSPATGGAALPLPGLPA
jgi:hypothetical protein